jgi:signal transduction histidine kinase
MATTAMTTTTDGVAPADRWRSLPSLRHGATFRLQRLGGLNVSIRARILTWFIGVLALATVASVGVTHEVLMIRLDQRIDAELTQEAAELRKLAKGKDPASGRPFGADVERIFDLYLRRNVPSRNEALITFVGGEPYLRSHQVVPFRLDKDPELVSRWGTVRAPDHGSVQTPAGRVEYLAVPLQADAETRGVFVAAIFVSGAKADVDSAVRAAGAVGLAMLLLGSILAWRLANRVVSPVTALTRTARSISETDFGGRIEVTDRDEVGELAATFNEMLDRLEQSFESQRHFIDDASHELKTPLTIIRGHLELLEDDPDAQQETLALVLDELDRMGRIVGDLLVLARHERPDFLAVSSLDVASLTDEISAKASALARREWVLAERGEGIVTADRQRLTQAMVQLADNAVRHGGGNGPILLGSSVRNGEARFWVRDHGRGIPAREQQEIFHRFRRANGSRRAEGAGLGLAIVKAIAEAHRGRVEVKSTVGAGSEFAIVIPVSAPGSARKHPR